MIGPSMPADCLTEASPFDADDAGRRLRVLVIVEAANPDWVSVPLVGWSIARALADVANVHLVTQVRNRDAFLARGLREGIDFTAIDTETIAAPAYRLASFLRGGTQKGWTTVTAIQSLTYPFFERIVWRLFKDRIARGEFDLVHRVTPLSPTTSSSLARHCARAGVPFVLGPLNGGLPWPKGFSRERAREREWLSLFRSASRWILPIRRTYRSTTAVIVGSVHTASEVRPYAGSRIIYIPENGVAATNLASRRSRGGSPLELCFVGRLVPYKNADIALRASAGLIRQGQARFNIIGDGPERPRLEQIVAELGISCDVVFHGWQTHAQVTKLFSQMDLLIFPSIREFGGGVVLEAMAAGVVPIVADYGGPAELVSQDSGFVVPLTSKEDLLGSLSRLLERIAIPDRDLDAKSRRAVTRVEQLYTWRRKAAQILQVYHWSLRQEGPPPNFGFIASERLS